MLHWPMSMSETYQFLHEQAIREHPSQLSPGAHSEHGKVSSMSEQVHIMPEG